MIIKLSSPTIMYIKAQQAPTIPDPQNISIWSMLCILKQLPLRDVSLKMCHRALETTESYWQSN